MFAGRLRCERAAADAANESRTCRRRGRVPPSRWRGRCRAYCGSAARDRSPARLRAPRRRRRRRAGASPCRWCREADSGETEFLETSCNLAHRAAGTSPSKGQPNAVAIAACTGITASPATLATSSNPASDSSIARFTFFRLWLSDAETNTTISSTAASAARNAPRLFGTSAASTAPRVRSTPRMTSSASASCGTARGDTKEVARSAAPRRRRVDR